MNKCIIEGCNTNVHGNGYCIKHYTRFRTHGDPLKTTYDREHNEKCSVLNCKMEYHSKGLCKIHYDKFYKFKTVKRQELFIKILDHYGHKCNCSGCSETNEKLLTLEHKNNDGGKHRKERKNNIVQVYQDVIDQGFPDTYEILCHNCNWGRYIYGICPHQQED